jgi:NAD+ synthase (glutamine-hydrolysing)
MRHGFVRVGSAIPYVKVADLDYNADQIIGMVKEGEEKGIRFLTFPELSLTSYTCADLFNQQLLIDKSLDYISKIAKETRRFDICFIIGAPLVLRNKLYNCGIVIHKGELLGAVPKSYIPNQGEFYEKRWFTSGKDIKDEYITIHDEVVPFGVDLLFSTPQDNVCFAVEICEDLWIPIPPSSFHSISGANLIFNLSSSNEIVGKAEYRKQLVNQQSGKGILAYVYASSGVGESTTDLVFGGDALISEYGSLLGESKRFSRENQLIFNDVDIDRLNNERMRNKSFGDSVNTSDYRIVEFLQKTSKETETIYRPTNPMPFVPSNLDERDHRCHEIFSIQTAALAKRLEITRSQKLVIGISGGLDSTLALLVAVKTLDLLSIGRENILAVTMPGFGTTSGTKTNALDLMKALGVTSMEIDIQEACLKHFEDIGHDSEVYDVTYENVQARERTQILMDLANKHRGLVIGTGDLSELAIGWCTYNADHMSMYSVNCSIPKTLVKYLVQWVADNVLEDSTREILKNIIDTPISPELLPPDAKGEIEQKTESIVGPYILHDFFMYHMLRYGAPPAKLLYLGKVTFKDQFSEDVIKKWLKIFIKRFFSQQFKRSCLPDGPKVGTISVSPRGDLRMPSDAEVKLWLSELD